MSLGHRRVMSLNLSINFFCLVSSSVGMSTSVSSSKNCTKRRLFKSLNVLMDPGWIFMNEGQTFKTSNKKPCRECIIGDNILHLRSKIVDVLTRGAFAIELVQRWSLEFMRVAD